MSAQEVPYSLRTLLGGIFEIPASEITPELSVETVESWDSFRHLQAMLAIEGKYGVELDLHQVADLTSVALLQAELEKQGAAL